MTIRLQSIFSCGILASLAAFATPASAVTIEVDGTNYTTLSAAVADAYANEDGVDIININVASLPAADSQIVLNKPITINGNANSRPAPNDKCDLLVDMATIMVNTVPDEGPAGKSYIDIETSGIVAINNLKIHPNADGLYGTGSGKLVSGIRMFAAPLSGEIGAYNLTKVWVSGSDGSNGEAYVSLETADDLYGNPNIRKWAGTTSSNDGSIGGESAIQFDKGTGLGSYNATLDHCHAGLSYGAAMNITLDGGTQTVLGGMFGHCGRDGIRCSGTGISLQGTQDDRLRIVRCTNISAANSHGIEVVADGEVINLEYVDVGSLTTANDFNFRSGHVLNMRYCRGLSKLDDGIHETVYINGAGTTVDNVEDCTFVGGGTTYVPMQITGAVITPISFKNCIFTSLSSGTIALNSAGLMNFSNCAFPTDGFVAETLNDPPFTGATSNTAVILPPYTTAPYNQSPHYMLTAAQYDWSPSQGAGKPGNSAGNSNVLRPYNPAYQTASFIGGPLTGGAGPGEAGIDSRFWMLME